MGVREGRRKGGRERRKEIHLFSREYAILNTKVVILFLGNGDLSQMWYLCKGDNLIFLRHKNKIESSHVAAVSPPLEGIQMLWSRGWHRPCGKEKGIAPVQACPEDTVQQQWRFLTMLKLVAKLLFSTTARKSAGPISRSLMRCGFCVKRRHQSHLFRVSKFNVR